MLDRFFPPRRHISSGAFASDFEIPGMGFVDQLACPKAYVYHADPRGSGMDETVVVTGAAYGLGAAIARAFGVQGATVVYGGPDAEDVESVTSDIEQAGGTACGVRADARDQFDLERLVELAAREAGPIDVLIPAAIVAHDSNGDQALPAVSYSAFDDVIRTNLRGRFAAIREAVPHFAEDGLVLVPLPVQEDPQPDRSRPVTISAAGARGLLQVAAMDLEQSVVGVELALPLVDEHREEALEDVAAAMTAGFDDVPAFDGRIIAVDAVGEEE